MLEPMVQWPEEGFNGFKPFSAASPVVLAGVVRMGQINSVQKDEWFDEAFRRQYAAILLRERGL